MPVGSSEDLYGLPLERFIEERAALAKQLRANKQRDEATRVTKLKKPTVAAWAVNQLVRTQPKLIDALLQSGEELAAAQAAGREGRDQLRAATGRQRAALDELNAKAEGLLSSDGHPLTPATLEKVNDTLRAAALAPDAREQFSTGCLVRELEPGGSLGLTAAPPPETGPPSKAAQSAGQRSAEQERARRVAERALREAEREAEHAVKELERAERRRDEAAAALADAERELAGARQHADRANTRLDQARRAPR